MVNVLVVDDDAALTRMLKIILSEKGFEVEIAVNGEEGLRKLKERKPDVLVLDIAMPKKDGWDVLKDLAASEDYRHIPVLIMTGRGELKQVVDGIHAADFIAKPFEMYGLIEKINKLCAQGKQKQVYILDSGFYGKLSELVNQLEDFGLKVAEMKDVHEFGEFVRIQKPDIVLAHAHGVADGHEDPLLKLEKLIADIRSDKPIHLLGYGLSAAESESAKNKYPAIPIFDISITTDEFVRVVKERIE